MRRAWWQRALAGVLGVWFTTTVTGLTLPACPEHGGGMLSIAQGAQQESMAEGTAHHMGHHAATDVASLDKSAPGAGHHDQHGHQCTCPGLCCATCAVTFAPARVISIPAVRATVVAGSVVESLDGAPRAPPDVVLPLPLGPPTLRV